VLLDYKSAIAAVMLLASGGLRGFLEVALLFVFV
jgi:hypothetical protein